MRISISRRLLGSSALAAALWILFAVVRWTFSQISWPAAQLAALVPAVVPPGLMQSESGLWLFLTVLIGGLAVALAHALFTVAAGRGGPLLVAAWFATVLAGSLVGLALDIANAWDTLAELGPRGLLVGEFGVAAASGALWGLTVGWMPGLLARTSTPDAGETEASRTPTRRPAWLLPAAVLAVVAVIVTGVSADNARTVAVEEEAAARQEAEAGATFGAMPDPDASGVSVPDMADATTDLGPDWCTPEKAMVLKGEPDGATGHRALPIRLMNFSDEPCVIEGYPDVAFGDQNQHLLAVNLEHGESFMAQDPGPQLIKVPAGGYAVSVLGWDAASTQGALVTKTVYAAATAGMARGSWPIDLDIVEGSTVAITAWAIDANPAPAE